MEVLRILNALRYDRRKQRFNSLAFKPFGKPPGISVIDTACIQDMGNTPCSHIRQYYDRIAGAPPIFWKFHTDLLPDQCVIEQEDSLTGDVCHYNRTYAKKNGIEPPVLTLEVCMAKPTRLDYLPVSA